jgi:hypothetical protein
MPEQSRSFSLGVIAELPSPRLLALLKLGILKAQHVTVFHIPPDLVVEPEAFTIALRFQRVPSIVSHQLMRPDELGVTHGESSDSDTRQPHHHCRFSERSDLLSTPWGWGQNNIPI